MNNPVLHFTEQFFSRLNFHVTLIPWDTPYRNDDLDLGLRKVISGKEHDILLNSETMHIDMPAEHILVIAEDRFRCRYLLVPVPGQELPVIMMAGPYLNTAITNADIMTMFPTTIVSSGLELFLTQYYSTLPCFENDHFLEDYMTALGDQLYGPGGSEVRFIAQKAGYKMDLSPKPSANQNQSIASLLKQRYDLEDRMMEAISRGDADTAISCLTNAAFSSPDIRTRIPLRSFMNYAIILNTLCRKAAQRGGVSPVLLDEISRRYAMKIERATKIAQVACLRREILRGYAMLVQSQSVSGYSPVIGDVINYIHLHYMENDLTLANMASVFNMNKSYLATLFKKETGKTLTSYVNEHRINRAIFLMNAGTNSIQDIAISCGIPDIAYFSHLFKKIKGITPTAYRKMITNRTIE